MTDTNLSLVLHGIKDLRLDDRPIPEPEPGEIQLSIRTVGICRTDVSYWQNGRVGDRSIDSPTVMGHEPSGVVTKLGAGVTQVRVGDRVAVEPNKPCSKCRMCKAGTYNLCYTLGYLASPPTDGCISRYSCHPADFVYKLPNNMSFEEGALVQPLSLGLHACRRGHVTVGQAVLVTGAGPLGMAVVLAAKARGAAKICVTDLNPDRLAYIQKIGATCTLTVKPEADPRDTAAAVVSVLGRESDVSIECSGAATAMAVYATKPSGVVVQVGYSSDTERIPLLTAILKELDIKGSCSLANDYETAIEAISSGQVNVRQLITHRFRLEQALEAYETSLKGEGVKIVIDCERHS